MLATLRQERETELVMPLCCPGIPTGTGKKSQLNLNAALSCSINNFEYVFMANKIANILIYFNSCCHL